MRRPTPLGWALIALFVAVLAFPWIFRAAVEIGALLYALTRTF